MAGEGPGNGNGSKLAEQLAKLVEQKGLQGMAVADAGEEQVPAQVATPAVVEQHEVPVSSYDEAAVSKAHKRFTALIRGLEKHPEIQVRPDALASLKTAFDAMGKAKGRLKAMDDANEVNHERRKKQLDIIQASFSVIFGEIGNEVSEGLRPVDGTATGRNEATSRDEVDTRYYPLADEIFAKGYNPNELESWRNIAKRVKRPIPGKPYNPGISLTDREIRAVRAELAKLEQKDPIVLPTKAASEPAPQVPRERARKPKRSEKDRESRAIRDEPSIYDSPGPMRRTDMDRIDPAVVSGVVGTFDTNAPDTVTEPSGADAASELDVEPAIHDSTPRLPADKFKDATPKSVRESLRRSILSIKELPPTEMPAGAIDTLPPDLGLRTTTPARAEALRSVVTPPGSIDTLPPVIDTAPQASAAPEPVLVAEVDPDAADAALAHAVFPSASTEGVANLPAVVNSEATPTWQPLSEQGLTQEELVHRRAERRVQIGVEAGLTQELGDMYNAREAYLTAYRAFYANNNLAARAAVQATNSTEWQNLKRLEAASATASLAYQQALERSATERLTANAPEREALLRAKGEARYLLLVGVGWNAPRYEDGRLMSKEDYVNQYMTQYQGRVLDRYMSTIAWREVTAGNENARIETRAEALGAKQRNVFDRMRSLVQATNQGLERTLTPTGARAFRIVAAAGVGTVLGGWAAGAMRGASVIAGMLTGSTAGAAAGSLFQRLVGARRAAAVDTVRHSRITSAADLTAAAAAFRKGDAAQIAATRRRWEMGVALGVAFLTARSMPGLEPVVTSSLSDLRRIGGEIMGTGESAGATAAVPTGGESASPSSAVTGGAGGSEGQSAPVAGGESGTGSGAPRAGGEGSGGAAPLDSSVPPPANNPGPAGSPFGRIPVPTDSVPQADAIGGFARESAIISGGNGGDAVSSEGLDDMRAVAAEVRGTSTEYVARSGDGGIKLVEGLQQQLAREGITETTPGISAMTREIASADTNAEAEAVAKKYGLYKPGVTDESAAIGKEARIRIDGEKLVLTDAKGEAVFIDEKNPYSGKMFDSNPPPPVREIPPETRASGERVAPSEAPPPAQREVVSSAGQEQIVPREEPPRVAGQTKSYWDMTEVEKTQHLNRLSIADARQARLDWEDYARKYDAYLEEVARERGVPAAAVVGSAPVASPAAIERDLQPVRVDASPTPASEPAPSAAKPAPEPVRPVPSPEGPPRDTISTDEAIRQFGDPQAAASRGATPTPAASESITTDEAINQLRAQKK
ncbi:MAG: hypothetical protein KBC38_00375 [Candidatus Pacebacteria bacterium]|nr:hypothetical protein [Candidatus Paceibacterota bacterium]MBP9840452.1 hypothetical protein [Candidatus Paceibacterota bacterium]